MPTQPILPDRPPSRARVSNHFTSTCRRRLPAYGRSLHPSASPVFITTSWDIAREWNDRGGVCLVCDDSPNRFDFTFLHGRLCWLLYRDDKTAAMELARAIAAYVDDDSEFVRIGTLGGRRHG